MNNRQPSNSMNREQENQFKSALETSLFSLGIDALAETQLRQLVKHYSMLREWNRRVNLTRITEPDEAAQFHYADSLFGGRFIRGARTLLDIGSGAGFPSVPLAVFRPDAHVTALEANQKKSLFLNEAKDALGLANFRVVNARIESFDRRSFDLLTSRALDRAEEVLPSTIRGMSDDQRFMLYCAPDLLAKVEERLSSEYGVEIQQVPRTESRLVAIFCTNTEVGQKRIAR